MKERGRSFPIGNNTRTASLACEDSSQALAWIFVVLVNSQSPATVMD